jgi:twinkle protein
METTKHNAPSAATQGETSLTRAYPLQSTATASSGTATTAAGKAGPGLTQRHLDILQTRGLSAEILSRFGVQSSKRLPGECIAIPFYRGEAIVNRKYRTIAGDKAMAQDQGADKCFWNVNALTDATLDTQPLIITEGEFDAMVALQCGFARALSVPDGAPAKPLGDAPSVKYAYLDELPGKDRAPEIILAVDGDGPGENLLNDLALRIGRVRCKWVQYPKARDPVARGRERLKDLNEVLEDYGEKGVVETISRARWMAVPGLYRMSELPPLHEPLSFVTHINGLDDWLHIRLGDFIVVTGIPGHGKSTFVNELCFNLARQEGANVTFASFEQMPQREHRRNLRTLYTGHYVKDSCPTDIAAADKFIDEKFGFIVPGEDDSPTLEWMLERAKAAVIRHFANVIVLDPWNEMDHTRPADMSLTEYVGEAIKALKRFAKNYNVALIVVAHPAKMKRDKDGVFPAPGLYDISDSANWSNKADLGIVIHRENDGTTAIRIAKARYADIGTVGEKRATFNVQTLRYHAQHGIDKEMAI